MKKKIAWILMLGCMLIGLLSGCGSSTAVNQIDTAQLADDIYQGVTWKDQISEVNLDKALKLYGISSDVIISGKVYISTNATAEEIAVFEVATEDQVSTVQTAVEDRVASQKASFESYNAEEVPKLNAPLIVTKGQYVILVVCDTTSEAKTVIDNAFSGN